MKIWTIVSVDSNIKIIKNRWIYAIKESVDDNIVKWKARWVTKDFRQKYEVDFFETYSEVIKFFI